jgi:hypothetical protein
LLSFLKALIAIAAPDSSTSKSCCLQPLLPFVKQKYHSTFPFWSFSSLVE